LLLFNNNSAAKMGGQRKKSMARTCQVSGRVAVRGKRYARRGIAKKKKGIGLKVTGIKRRRFQPNLFKKRFWLPEENRFITLNVSARGMRTIDKHGLGATVRQMRTAGEKI
jgi:large subunit ribosomal protein L28